MVDFPSNGTRGRGYLAVPEGGSGPGVVVLQEWWGLNDQIKRVVDRYAAEGFVALAPDIYRGVVTDEPDEAGKLLMALNLEQAAKDMAGAVDHLAAHAAVSSAKVGVTGFCMGGGLTLMLATQKPEQVGAAVPYYGVIAWPSAQPDYTRLAGPVLGHYAELDEWAPPATVEQLDATLKALGKSCEFFVYPGTDHAFANDERPEVYDAEAAELAWTRTVDFLRTNLT